MFSEWQKRVKCELIMRDMEYEDLAKAVGSKSGYVRQMLCSTYAHIPQTNPTKQRISKFLGLEEIE